MSMSRKDYIAIADNFCFNFSEVEMYGPNNNLRPAMYSKQQIAELLASCLRGTNPRFDRGRFVRRCMQGCSDSEFAKRIKRAKRNNKRKAA